MATDTSKSYQCQVFRNNYFSLYRGIKENLSEVVPKLEAAGILTPGTQEASEEKSCDQDKRTMAILNAVEEKLMENLESFWRLVSILRSLPVLARLAGVLEEAFWKSSEELVGDMPPKTPDRATPTKVPEGATPTKVPEGDTPTKVPEGATPTKVPDGDTPTKVPDGDTPTQIPDEATPTKVPKGDTPTQIPNEATPTIDTESKTESESISAFLSPTEGDLGHSIEEIVLPRFSVRPFGENELPEMAKSFPSITEPSSGPAVSGNFTESQLETADDRIGGNMEQREVLHHDQTIDVPLRRDRMKVSNSDEELVHLKSLERAVGKMVSAYVLGEKANLEADYEEKCESIRAECKQELDAMNDYYQNVEEELKLADSSHAAEIKYLKRTHEEEKEDLISTRQLQAKIKDTELEQKQKELKALQEEYEKKLEEVQEMEIRLEAMKEEVEVMAKKVQAKEEGLRKWKSLEEVKNKMTTCKEIGELISQWFEGNRDEAIKKQIEGKIQDIKSKRRGSKTL